jgi:hypothetical protein
MNVVPGDSLILEILAWVGMAFAAGFIGYFGRHLSMMLIERSRRKKSGGAQPATETVTPAQEEERSAQLKLEKKRAKAEAKKLKKEGKNQE